MTRTLLALAATAACGWAQPNSASLNGVWRFALAATPAAGEALAHFYENNFAAADFRPIPVPSNWSLQGFEEPMYGKLKKKSEGFYLHRFQPQRAVSGKRVLLHFDGVWASAEVWLNGEPLGRHDSGFTAFAFDVTGSLRADRENLLAVRVRQVTKDYLYDTNDDWSLGGIYQDVWLEWMPADCYIDRVETFTDFDDQFRDADLGIRAFVTQAKNAAHIESYELQATLLGPDGKEVQRRAIGVPGHVETGRDTLLRMRVNAPAHWTAETPRLYAIRVDLLVAGAVVHSRAVTVGFRHVSAANGVLRINGQPVKLRGVDRHDEHPDVGRATRPRDWLEDIRLMKAANINFVRTSHYPPAEGFIRLCDEMGLYVLDEIPMGYGGDLAADPSLAGGALLRAQETLARDRNHPSVIIWSIGNEDPLTVTHLAVIRLVKGSDPTRPVLMPGRADEWLPPEVDILAPHYLSAADYDRLAGHSARPVLTTEFTHALGQQGFGGLVDRWRALIQHPAGAGGAIWMWQDQGLNVGGKLLLNPSGIDGIVNSDRTPQRDYFETKAVYAPVTAPASMKFEPGQPSLAIPIRNEFDFTNLDAILIRWKLLADDREIAAGEARAAAEPHATAILNLPLSALGGVRPGVAYYTHLAFVQPDGSQMVTRSVELRPDHVPELGACHKPVQIRRGATLALSACGSTYEFSPESGQLLSASAGGHTWIRGVRLTLWRPLTGMETDTYLHGKGKLPNLPDLNRYATTVRNWKQTRDGDIVNIEVESENNVDERNEFSSTCRFQARPDGSLLIEYSIRPRIEAPWVPEAGLAFSTAAELDTLHWLGLGPLDSYPNEREAAIFGMWKARSGAEDAHNQKSGVRHADLVDPSGNGFRVSGAPYVRFDGQGQFKALSTIVGRPEKNRRPDEPVYRLDVTSGTVFSGAVTLTILHEDTRERK